LDLGELPGFGDWQGLISGTYSSRYDEDLNLIGVSTSWSVDELIAPPQRIELLAGLALSIRQATNFGATTGSAEFADGVARIEHLDSTGPDIALNIDSGTANISPSYRLTGLDLTVGLVLGQSWVDGNSLQPLLDAIPLLATGCEDNTCRFRFSGNPSRPTVAAALQ
ncbi:MAG: hypothetical protein KC561_06155, partial [Myxococcales bacterium]|nr:hypothetical protein [Myxococcales bacterium]